MGRLPWATPEIALATDVNFLQMALAARFDEQDDLHRAIYAAAGAKLPPKRGAQHRRPKGAEILGWARSLNAGRRAAQGRRG